MSSFYSHTTKKKLSAIEDTGDTRTVIHNGQLTDSGSTAFFPVVVVEASYVENDDAIPFVAGDEHVRLVPFDVENSPPQHANQIGHENKKTKQIVLVLLLFVACFISFLLGSLPYFSRNNKDKGDNNNSNINDESKRTCHVELESVHRIVEYIQSI